MKTFLYSGHNLSLNAQSKIQILNGLYPTGCGVFKWGVQNWKDFLPKNKHAQEIIEF